MRAVPKKELSLIHEARTGQHGVGCNWIFDVIVFPRRPFCIALPGLGRIYGAIGLSHERPLEPPEVTATVDGQDKRAHRERKLRETTRTSSL
jgi:hypothetical protein